MLFKSAKAAIKNVGGSLAAELSEKVSDGKIASRLERIAADPKNNFYLDAWAVSSHERYGLNENFDGFEHEELKNSFATFKGSWSCLDHNNWHEALAVGTNVDAVYSPDQYVRIVMAINREKAERRHPGIEQKIASGRITDVSMGALCRESVCTVPKCANIATDESQFCDHVRYLRGQTLCNEETGWQKVVCGELNRGVIFFEESIITDSEGADRNAKILNKIAMQRSAPKSVSFDSLYHIISDLSKKASSDEKVALAHITEHLMRVL